MNIYEKIVSVMKDIEYLSKDDTVAFGNTKYKAISEEKVTSTVRKSMIEYGLAAYPIKQDHKREGTLSTVDVTYRIVNAENPEEYIDVVSSGTGSDTQDKGVGKAMTYAYKYMLLRTFAIPTGEDPDKISSKEQDDKQTETELQKYCKENSLSYQKILDSYKVKDEKSLTKGQLSAIQNKKNHSLFMGET